MLIVLLYVVGLIVALVFGAATALFVREQIRWRPLVRLVSPKGQFVVIPPQETETAISAAAARRKFIEAHIGPSMFEVPRIEIMEVPPGRGEISFGELPQGEAIGQAVTLRWQLNDDAFLLLGRVADALNVVARRLDIEPWRLASTIELTRLEPKVTRTPNAFPYMVVINTNEEGTIRQEIGDLASWFGIGVTVQRGPQATEFGQCQVPGGLPGCVGGDIRGRHDGTYGLTCAHVVSKRCQSALFKTDLNPRSNEPDVAVLRSDNPCFAAPAEVIEVAPIDQTAAELLGNRSVTRFPGANARGALDTVALWASYANRTHVFPHAVIKPDVKILFDLIAWPPWRKHFSRGGDSGSWVITTEGRKWVGMLVGGSEFHHLSYAILSAPLLAFLDATMNQHPVSCFAWRN